MNRILLYLPLANKPPAVPKGDWPGNSGYGPALWNAWEKLGLYMAVGAEPVAVLAMPSPFIGVPNPVLDTLKKIHSSTTKLIKHKNTLPKWCRFYIWC